MILKQVDLTLFLSELELSGSSAANMAEEIMMQTNTMLPKYGWLQMKWQNTRNLVSRYKFTSLPSREPHWIISLVPIDLSLTFLSLGPRAFPSNEL